MKLFSPLELASVSIITGRNPDGSRRPVRFHLNVRTMSLAAWLRWQLWHALEHGLWQGLFKRLPRYVLRNLGVEGWFCTTFEVRCALYSEKAEATSIEITAEQAERLSPGILERAHRFEGGSR